MPNVFSDSAKRHCLIEFLVLATFCRFIFSPLQLFVISEAAFRANSFWFISKRNFCVLLPPANEVCEGYVFTGVCHSVHRGGGVRGCSGGGACMVAPGGACVVAPGGRGACVVARGACVVALGGMVAPGGMWLLWGACVVARGACVVAPGGVGHAWLLLGGHAWFFR